MLNNVLRSTGRDTVFWMFTWTPSPVSAGLCYKLLIMSRFRSGAVPTTLVVRASLNQVVSNNKLHNFGKKQEDIDFDDMALEEMKKSIKNMIGK